MYHLLSHFEDDVLSRSNEKLVEGSSISSIMTGHVRILSLRLGNSYLRAGKKIMDTWLLLLYLFLKETYSMVSANHYQFQIFRVVFSNKRWLHFFILFVLATNLWMNAL